MTRLLGLALVACFAALASSACSESDSDGAVDEGAGGEGAGAGGSEAGGGGNAGAVSGAGGAGARGEGEPIDESIQALFVAGESTTVDDPRVLEEDFEGECPSMDACDENTAPVLGEPIIEINGRVFPDLSDVRNGDSITILVSFEDTECNLACGSDQSSYISPQSDSTGASSLPTNVPCSTEESGVHLAIGIPIGSLEGPGNEGRIDHYLAEVNVRDVCGELAEPLQLEFDVAF